MRHICLLSSLHAVLQSWDTPYSISVSWGQRNVWDSLQMWVHPWDPSGILCLTLKHFCVPGGQWVSRTVPSDNPGWYPNNSMTLIKSLQEVSPFQRSDQGQCLGHRHHLTKGECGFGLEKLLSSKAEIKVALVRVKRQREFPGTKFGKLYSRRTISKGCRSLFTRVLFPWWCLSQYQWYAPRNTILNQLASEKGSLSFKGPGDNEPTGRITTNSTPSHTVPTVSSSVNLLSVSTCLGLTEVVGHWEKWVKTEDKFSQLGKWETRKPLHFPNVSLCSAEKWDPDPHGRCTPHLWGGVGDAKLWSEVSVIQTVIILFSRQGRLPVRFLVPHMIPP